MMGHGGKSDRFKRSLKMNVSSQKRVIREFKAGKLNLLVATQVAEEGLDIKTCNVVVRYRRLTEVTTCQTR
jgi:ERCC4-related helicase